LLVSDVGAESYPSPQSMPETGKQMMRPISQGQYKGQKDERRKRIKDIIASKRQSTIKDIAEQVPEYSEKTLQREIALMVAEGLVLKQGERRWSRYSLVPGV